MTGAAEGTTVKVTINFDRSSVSPEYKVDFESALTSYEESWVFSGVEQSNYIYHAGENCGRAYNGSTITTATKTTDRTAIPVVRFLFFLTRSDFIPNASPLSKTPVFHLCRHYWRIYTLHNLRGSGS